MSNASIQDGRRNLRRDLTSVQVAGQTRPYRMVIDEIGGRFARVSEHVWQRLRRGDQDAELWAEANAAGWLRTRTPLPKRRFSPSVIRIRLGSIDWLASLLANASGCLFSSSALVFWLTAIAITAIAVVSRADQWLTSLALLPTYLKQLHPLTVASLFVFTKTIHELGHAVMCRRLGARCGDVGILLLCGMPCPYCDVTDIWRQPSSCKRAWVMLAGIYVELIIATIAAVVWMNSHDQSTQLAAMNVVLVCAVSTIVFNANPLLRYDGYYVLADLLCSANLRHESRMAFKHVVTRRLAGREYASPKKSGRRSLLLAVYHAASQCYRLVICCAIAALLIQYASWLGLRTVAISLVVIVAFLAIGRILRSFGRILTGHGAWSRVPRLRRVGPVGLMTIFIILLLYIPMPRYRSAVGLIDVANARPVFIPQDGLVDEVLIELGQTVRKGETLARLDRETMMVRQTKLEGEVRLAKMRSDLARRVALDNTRAPRPKIADQWKTLQAAEEAVETQLISMRRRVQETDVRSPVNGVVIPASANEAGGGWQQNCYLANRVGTAVNAGREWCRVSESGQIQATLVLDARDRSSMHVGSTVMISSLHSPQTVIKSKVMAVSAIRQLDSSSPQSAGYQVLCPLPEVMQDQLMLWVGQECRGVFRLPPRTLASAAKSWLEDWFRG